MFQDNLIILFTQNIPESISITFTATVFLKAELNKKLILIIGVISGLSIFVLRQLPLTTGFHTIINIFLLTIMLNYYFNKNSIKCFIAVLKTIFILTIIEVIVPSLIIKFTYIDLNYILESPLITTLIMLPQIIFVFLIGFIIYKRRKIYEL